jgi:molecular chaperone DnaK
VTVPPKVPPPNPESLQRDWRISIKCPEWKQVARLASLNAGPGGIFLNTPREPAMGSGVELQVELPNGNKLKLVGHVQRVLSSERAKRENRSPGVAIKLDPEHEAQLRKHAEEAKPGANGPSKTRKSRPDGMVAGAIGIDFGTTYTSASAAIGSWVTVIPDEAGRILQPSLVAFPDGGPPCAGWKAQQVLVQDPRRAVSSIKRLLGRNFSDPAVAGMLQQAAYRTSRGVNDSVVIEIDDKSHHPVDICALVIGHVRQIAEKYLGTPVTRAVFTVPVSFGTAQRDALRRAAQMAQLEVLDIFVEPLAGAFAYGMGQKKNEMVAVYDFGGGTFDFCVLDVVHDNFHVLGAKGDAWLGGDDFDLSIANSIADRFWRDHQIELRQRVVEWQRLLLACERAKRDLSSAESSEVLVEGIVDSPTPMDIRQSLSRPEFEALCKEFLERSLATCVETLESLKLAPSDLTDVVVMGGVSRIPFVRSGVRRFFERELPQIVNPEEAVALGAGLRAAQCVNHPVEGIAPIPTSE